MANVRWNTIPNLCFLILNLIIIPRQTLLSAVATADKSKCLTQNYTGSALNKSQLIPGWE